MRAKGCFCRKDVVYQQMSQTGVWKFPPNCGAPQSFVLGLLTGLQVLRATACSVGRELPNSQPSASFHSTAVSLGHCSSALQTVRPLGWLCTSISAGNMLQMASKQPWCELRSQGDPSEAQLRAALHSSHSSLTGW